MKIDWTEPALNDLVNIRDYIARDSEYYAARFVERVIESVESLEIFPERGRRVPESKERNIRELLFYGYRIVYRVETERILILAVIHGSRNLRQKSHKPWDIT